MSGPQETKTTAGRKVRLADQGTAAQCGQPRRDRTMRTTTIDVGAMLDSLPTTANDKDSPRAAVMEGLKEAASLLSNLILNAMSGMDPRRMAAVLDGLRGVFADNELANLRSPTAAVEPPPTR